MDKMQNIPVFILAGGTGTRLSEETQLKPKPMVEIAEVPIIVHIMHWYYHWGFNDFVICAGYKSWDIKQYFLNYEFRQNHLNVDHRVRMDRATILGHNLDQPQWRVRVIDTGLECMTGARVARAFDAIKETDTFDHFALTYGDGLSDVKLQDEFNYHKGHGRMGTILGVRPSARFGELDVKSNGHVAQFLEKPQSRQGLINGGFFFFKKEFRKYLTLDSDCTLERKPLSQLALDGQLMMHEHAGFWHPMDTLRDKNYLQQLWDEGQAPWSINK